MNGLSGINIELTSRCNKSCWCCGRRQIEKERPELADWGDMEFSLLEKIAGEIPSGIVVQLHNNGEPLMYHRFGDAVKLFRHCLTSIDTNGKLLVDKGCEIVDNLDTIAVSIIENDPEADEQYEILERFLRLKGKFKPLVILRLNGAGIDQTRYKDLGCLIATRVLHSPMGSFDYINRETTKPEIGVCWEILHRLAIDRNGNVSICVRFDPDRKGVLGNVKEHSLEDMWNAPLRKAWLDWHKRGKRCEVPLCSKCDYWGLPTGW